VKFLVLGRLASRLRVRGESGRWRPRGWCIATNLKPSAKMSTSDLGWIAHPIANLGRPPAGLGRKPAASPFALCRSTSPRTTKGCWSAAGQERPESGGAFRRAARPRLYSIEIQRTSAILPLEQRNSTAPTTCLRHRRERPGCAHCPPRHDGGVYGYGSHRGPRISRRATHR